MNVCIDIFKIQFTTQLSVFCACVWPKMIIQVSKMRGTHVETDKIHASIQTFTAYVHMSGVAEANFNVHSCKLKNSSSLPVKIS